MHAQRQRFNFNDPSASPISGRQYENTVSPRFTLLRAIPGVLDEKTCVVCMNAEIRRALILKLDDIRGVVTEINNIDSVLPKHDVLLMVQAKVGLH